ncbi:MAG: hypothetical protein JOZ41_00970 [Chloroflexi bacterium]|nr:hypothetical protein [Chloroflexota bacterium]
MYRPVLTFLALLIVLQFNPGFALATPGPYAILQGKWVAHIGALKVHGDGDGWFSYRVYRTCSASPPPCDRIIGNYIYDGGFMQFQLTSIHGTSATGTILYSSFGNQTGTSLTLHRRTDGNIEIRSLFESTNKAMTTTLCKPAHWLPQCGA